jgi:ankyrin repeat protein
MKVRKLLFIVFILNLIFITFSFAGELMNMFIYKDFDAVKKLLAAGVDVNEKDEQYGSTPLMMAASYTGYEDMVKLLLENGADPNLQDKTYGTTALIAGAGISKEMVELLLEHGADINIKRFDGTGAFTSSISGILSDRVTTEVTEILLIKGADVNEAATSGAAEGYTCLMMAARNKASDLVKFLIKHKANLNAKAKDGATALSLAKKEKDENMIKLLIEIGAKE